MRDDQIDHNAEDHYFYISLDDGSRAHLKYRLSDSDSATPTIDFYSTYVPDNHRGKGLAAKLVEHGFVWAESQKLQIRTTCWYARAKYADRATSE